MKHIEYIPITSEPYSLKHYEAYITPRKIIVLSYDLGRALTLEEILGDEYLLQVLNPYLYILLEGT